MSDELTTNPKKNKKTEKEMEKQKEQTNPESDVQDSNSTTAKSTTSENSVERKNASKGNNWPLILGVSCTFLLCCCCLVTGVSYAVLASSDFEEFVETETSVNVGDSNENSNSQDPNTETESGITETGEIGEAVEIQGIEVIATDTDSEFDTEEVFVGEGNIMYAVEVEITNNTDSEEYIGIFDFFMNTDLESDVAPTFLNAKSPIFSSVYLAPGETASGWVTFEVEEGFTESELVYQPFALSNPNQVIIQLQ